MQTIFLNPTITIKTTQNIRYLGEVGGVIKSTENVFYLGEKRVDSFFILMHYDSKENTNVDRSYYVLDFVSDEGSSFVVFNDEKKLLDFLNNNACEETRRVKECLRCEQDRIEYQNSYQSTLFINDLGNYLPLISEIVDEDNEWVDEYLNLISDSERTQALKDLTKIAIFFAQELKTVFKKKLLTLNTGFQQPTKYRFFSNHFFL